MSLPDYVPPEENLARRVVERFSLSPPIDIEELAAKYADVAYDTFPVEVDGISIGLKRPDVRPKIRVNSNISHRRKRFTLAHELGHVLIPWHTGTIVDELSQNESDERSQYWRMEAEANRFAACLLMPNDWASQRFSETEKMAVAVNQISEIADVSIDAAVLKALKMGPSGYLLAKSQFGLVEWSNATQGTNLNRIPEGSMIPSEPEFPVTYYGVNESSSAEYHWWKARDHVEIPQKPEETWRELLSGIISETCSGDPIKVKQSINGIVSAANGSVRENRSIETVYARTLQRVANRNDYNPDVTAAISHKHFDAFVIARVYSFFE